MACRCPRSDPLGWGMDLLGACAAGVVVTVGLLVRWRRTPARLAARGAASSVVGVRGGRSVAVGAGPQVRLMSGRILRQVDMVAIAGVVTGVLFVGPASRLAMRLDAAGDGARVGAPVTAEGTVFLVVFFGVAVGLTTAALFALLRPLLGDGLRSGAGFGLMLLVVVGPLNDPIRADTGEFGLIGPGLVPVLALVAMAVVQGAFLGVLMARLDAAVPLPSARARAWAWYLPLAPLASSGAGLIGFVSIPVAGGVGVAVRAVSAATGVSRRRVVEGGRVVLALVVLLALPRFITAIVTIAAT